MKSFAIVALSALCLANISAAEEHEADQPAHSDAIVPASFKAGRGLALAPQTQRILGLKTEEVAERVVTLKRALVVQIFDSGPPAKGSVSLPTAEAEDLAKRRLVGAKFMNLDRGAGAGSGFAELLFELPAGPTAKLGDFVSIEVTSAPGPAVTAVPSSSILDTISGSFVYVVNGDHFLRTAVKTGARDSQFIEITDGLYAGDVVVTRPVQTLWLIELRLVSGGGDDD